MSHAKTTSGKNQNGKATNNAKSTKTTDNAKTATKQKVTALSKGKQALKKFFKNPKAIAAMAVSMLFLVTIAIAGITNQVDLAKTYEINVEDAEDVKCEKNGYVNYCSGKITLSAYITDTGYTGARDLKVNYPSDAKLRTDVVVGNDKIPESKYAEILETGIITSKKTLILEDGNDKKRAVYNLDIDFKLDNDDKRKILALQTAASEKKIAEEKAAQEAKLKAEEEKRQREAEAQLKAEAEAAQKATKEANSKKQTTAHLACKHYAESKFFPYKVKFHSILGVAYDNIRSDGAWVYYVNMTIKSKDGGEVKQQMHCAVGDWNSDFSGGRVIEFSLGEWT